MKEQEERFTQLVREYKNTIYTVCMMFAESPDETDDMVQEALINLWRGFQKADDICKSWVWRVTMNSCITIDRKKRKRSSECPLTADIEDMLHSDENNRNTNVKILYDRIHQALRHILSAKYTKTSVLVSHRVILSLHIL